MINHSFIISNAGDHVTRSYWIWLCAIWNLSLSQASIGEMTWKSILLTLGRNTKDYFEKQVWYEQLIRDARYYKATDSQESVKDSYWWLEYSVLAGCKSSRSAACHSVYGGVHMVNCRVHSRYWVTHGLAYISFEWTYTWYTYLYGCILIRVGSSYFFSFPFWV